MKEIKHYKVKVLPNNPRPNSVYYVKNTGDEVVTTYITDLNGIPVPLLGQTGIAIGDKNHVHNQLSATNIWEVTHNLAKYPSVTIVDSGGNVVVGEIQYISLNQLIITFQASFSGKAFIN